MRIISGALNNILRCTTLKKPEELTEDEKDDIKDTIKDIMARVFKSGKLKVEEDKQLLLNNLKNTFGIKYFLDIISPKNKKEEKIEKIVQDNSFQFLSEIIYEIFLKFVDIDKDSNKLQIAIRILKFCDGIKFCKAKNQYIKLIEDLYPKLAKEQYTFFECNKFWELYIIDELDEEERKVYEELLKKKAKKEEEDKEEDVNLYVGNEKYFKHIALLMEDIFTMMAKLRVNTDYIFYENNRIMEKFCTKPADIDAVFKKVIIEYNKSVLEENKTKSV